MVPIIIYSYCNKTLTWGQIYLIFMVPTIYTYITESLIYKYWLCLDIKSNLDIYFNLFLIRDIPPLCDTFWWYIFKWFKCWGSLCSNKIQVLIFFENLTSHSYISHLVRCSSRFSNILVVNSQSPHTKSSVLLHFPMCTSIVSTVSEVKWQVLHLYEPPAREKLPL